MKPTDAQVGYHWLTSARTGPNATPKVSRSDLRASEELKRLHLMDGDMADLLSECISTASYKIHEQVRQSY